jgi:hypothetical protein
LNKYIKEIFIEMEKADNNNSSIIIGIPIISQAPLLQPYPYSIKRECKTFCKDLLNLLIPIICVFGVIALTMILLIKYLK